MRPLRPPVRACAGLLRRRDLRQLRSDRGPRARPLLPALGLDHALHGGRAGTGGAPGDRVSAVVLPVQPESLARARVADQARADTVARPLGAARTRRRDLAPPG